MSYCRFSHDDFQCDAYCYNSQFSGYTVAVAAYKCAFDKELPPKIPFTLENAQAWLARHALVSAMVKSARHEPIGLPCDGKVFTESTPGAAARKLEELAALGYRIPLYAIEALYEEQAELDHVGTSAEPRTTPNSFKNYEEPFGLSLHPGGTLLHKGDFQDEHSKEWCVRAVDVTRQAVNFLFSKVELSPATTLRDVFSLLRNNPVLQEIFSEFDIKGLMGNLDALPPRFGPTLDAPALSLQEVASYVFELDTYTGLGTYALRWGNVDVADLSGNLLENFADSPLHVSKTFELTILEDGGDQLDIHNKPEFDEPTLWTLLNQLLSALGRPVFTTPALESTAQKDSFGRRLAGAKTWYTPRPKSLILAPGAWLSLTGVDSKEDVSKEAHKYLCYPLELQDYVTLADVLRIVQASPVLIDAFKRYFAKEILQEAEKGPAWTEYGDSDPLEYLQVNRVVKWDSATNTWDGSEPAEFFGFGAELNEDLVLGGTVAYKAGNRVKYGISAATVRSMLHLPVYVNQTVDIQEADRHSTRYFEILQSPRTERLTLGAFLHSIFEALSAYGPPTCEEDHLGQIKEVLEEQTNQGVTHTTDDVFVALGFKSLAELYREFFENSDSFVASDIQACIRDLPDHEFAAVCLERSLLSADNGDKLQLKQNFASITGRALRVAIHDSHVSTAKLRTKH